VQKVLILRHSFICDIWLFVLFPRDFPSALPGVYEQVVKETEKLLEERGLSKLTSQQKDMLKRQTEEIASADNAILSLLSKY